MKPYHQLTFRGKIRRLRRLCLTVLEAYPIDVARVRYLTTQSTTMFRVDARDGGKYVFRVYSQADSSLAENRAEMFWLAALVRETGLPVVRPVARADGEYLSILSVDGVPGERRCALYEWVPGVPMEKYLSRKIFQQLGAVMAGLHNHAQGLRLPAEIRPKRWDKVFYFPGERAVYHLPEYSRLFTPEQKRMLDKACARVNPFLARLYQRGREPFIIHADLNLWNAHVYRGKLYVLDFEDMVMGYPEQDIAICLYYTRNHADYAGLAAALREAYQTARPWPSLGESDLHMLWAARMVNFANYAAYSEHAFDTDEETRDFIRARCEELDKYLE
jgi:Ser/Thr protein kinase RdoA (MazF antagonist)